MKDIKIFLKKKKKKSNNMFVNITKTSQKMKKINWLTTEMNFIKLETFLLYLSETFVLKNNDLESSFDEEYKDVLKDQF